MNQVPAEMMGTFLATFVRGAAFLSTMPVIGDTMVPRRVRVVAAAVFAMVLAPVRAPVSTSDLITALPAEILVGLVAAFAGRLVMAGISAGAELIGMQLGLGFAGAFDPNQNEVAAPMRRIASVVGGFAFLLAGGLEAVVAVMVAPIGRASMLMVSVRNIIDQSADLMVVALRFAAPAMIAGLVANVAMGLMSRAAPAMNVFSVMLALILFLGLGVLLVTAPGFARDVSTLGRLAVDSMRKVALP